MTRKDIWTAIWYAENSTARKTADFLRSLLPSKSPSSSGGLVKLAVVVGHNSKAQGAYAPYPINQTEYQFNSQVAKEMVKMAENDPLLQIKVFYRKSIKSYSAQIDEVYRRVNDWNPELAYELHFNWLNQAGRVEMIYFDGSEKGECFAKYALD